MNEKIRALYISTSLNVLLSLLKFILYWISGSMVILAEAWHSVSDIGTSLIVLISILRAGSETEKLKVIQNEKSTPIVDIASSSRIREFFRKTSMEHYAAFGIGAFLSLVAVSLIIKVINWQKAPIEKPVISGLLFFLFAMGSYFISRFEMSMGFRTHSIGLVSDGLHSKADMISSLLAGSSLILYALGVDIDRFMAFTLSLFIFGFALETLLGVLISRLKGTSLDPDYSKSFGLFFLILDPGLLKQKLKQLDEHLGLPILKHSLFIYRIFRFTGWIITGGIIVLYLSSSIYIVGPSEQSIIERFGKPINIHSPDQPGLHFKMPWPIDRSITLDTHTVRRRTIGNVQDETTFVLLWTKSHGKEEPFLTGDNHFFLPYVIIHYRIGDIAEFLFQHAAGEELLDSLTLSIASQLFAGATFNEIIGEKRAFLENLLESELQRELDDFAAGIDILGVHFRDMHPPILIANSFEAVIASRQEKDLMINQAYGYRNQQLAVSRGNAAREIGKAESYVTSRIHHAEGESSRFISQLLPDLCFRDITQRRVYLDTIQETLRKKDLILVDPDVGIPSIYLENINVSKGYSGSSYHP